MKINGREIGPNFPPYIVAEMSANHNGDLKRAIQLINEAKAAGAHAVKIQTYTADTITINSGFEDFKITQGYGKIERFMIYTIGRTHHGIGIKHLNMQKR